MSDWPISEYSHYKSNYKNKVQQENAKADCSPELGQMIQDCFIKWWGDVYKSWQNNSNFIEEYPTKYLSEWLAKVSSDLAPIKYFSAAQHLLSTDELSDLDLLLNGRLPEGRMSWWICRAVAKLILDSNVPLLMRDSAWNLIDEFNSKPCIVEIESASLSSEQKEQFKEWAVYCGANASRWFFTMDRDNYSQYDIDWADKSKQTLPTHSILNRFFQMNSINGIDWVMSQIRHDPRFFCELCECFDNPLIMGNFVSANEECYTNVEYLINIISNSNTVCADNSGAISWKQRSFIPILLQLSAQHTVKLSELCGDIEPTSVGDTNLIEVWRCIFEAVRKRDDWQIILHAFALETLKTIRAQPCPASNRTSIELNILRILELVINEQYCCNNWPLEYLKEYQEEAAMWHFLMKPEAEDSGNLLNDKDVKWFDIWLKNTYISLTYQRRLTQSLWIAVVGILKEKNRFACWMQLWDRYSLTQEKSFWETLKHNENTSFNCLWMGVHLLNSWLFTEDKPNEQLPMIKFIWNKLLRMYLDSSYSEACEALSFYFKMLEFYANNDRKWLLNLVLDYNNSILVDDELMEQCNLRQFIKSEG